MVRGFWMEPYNQVTSWEVCKICTGHLVVLMTVFGMRRLKRKKKRHTSSQLWHFSSALLNKKWFISKFDPKFETTVYYKTLNIPEKTVWGGVRLYGSRMISCQQPLCTTENYKYKLWLKVILACQVQANHDWNSNDLL